MKSFFLVFLVASAAMVANAQDLGSIGTDFVIDNILKPMLSGIYENTVGFLINQLFGGLLGKRDLSGNFTEIISQLSTIFESLKDKLISIVQNFGSQLQDTIGNIFKPGQNYAELLATVKNLLKNAVSQFLTQITQLFQQFFGQNRALRGIFDNLTQIMNEFVNTIHQSLSIYAENLMQAVQAASSSIKPMIGNLSQTVVNAVQQAIQHLNQIIAQISGN